MFDVLKRGVMRSRVAVGLPPQKRRAAPIVWPKRDPLPLLTFQWWYADRRGKVRAKTRVDARSLIKRELSIPIKQRLPLGVAIIRTS